ncbi:hypothetical protein HDU84_004326 [Entophlyctis sp. JEL0112]|nr:hypothetical protein HDU84_004326 [Entophlyctis sp. JEL0112]
MGITLVTLLPFVAWIAASVVFPLSSQSEAFAVWIGFVWLLPLVIPRPVKDPRQSSDNEEEHPLLQDSEENISVSESESCRKSKLLIVALGVAPSLTLHASQIYQQESGLSTAILILTLINLKAAQISSNWRLPQLLLTSVTLGIFATSVWFSDVLLVYPYCQKRVTDTLAFLFLRTLFLDALARSCNSRSKPSPYDSSSLLSYYTFWWIKPTLDSANMKYRLDTSDLPTLADADQPEHLGSVFNEWWAKNKGTASSSSVLIATAFSLQIGVFWRSFLHGTVFLVCMFIDPILMNILLEKQESFWKSFGLVVALSGSMFVRVTCMEIC